MMMVMMMVMKALYVSIDDGDPDADAGHDRDDPLLCTHPHVNVTDVNKYSHVNFEYAHIRQF
jgi:hypothetical protein